MTQAERLLHRAHLRYQRQAMWPDRVALPCDEVRGVRYRYDVKDWLQEQRRQQRCAVLSGLRSNFWKAYVDTVVFMTK